MEEEQVKNCLIKLGINFADNLQMDKSERMWVNGMKLILYYNLRDNFIK